MIERQHGDAAIDGDMPGDHGQVRARSQRQRADVPLRADDPVPVSVFDLDRTLTRRPTYTALLVYAAARLAPLRLALAPAVVAAMIAYLLKLITRKQLKEIEHWLLLGNAVDRADVEWVAAAFASRLAQGGFHADGVARIARDRADGRRIVLATAACRFYVDAIADALGMRPDEIVATESTWNGQRLSAHIAGSNCYGQVKRDMLEEYLRSQGLCRRDVDLRFFTDDISDRATLDWADEPIAVNPSKRLRKLAQSRGWPVLDWS